MCCSREVPPFYQSLLPKTHPGVVYPRHQPIWLVLSKEIKHSNFRQKEIPGEKLKQKEDTEKLQTLF
jgi:hypothetical protein